MPALPYWLFPGDDRPTEEIDDEIAEELQLHLDLLAEEQERRGMPPEEAKRKAAERFGDFNDLLRRCRREKQGDIPMLRRIQAVLIGLLCLAVTLVAWNQWRILGDESRNSTLMTTLLITIQSDLAEMRTHLEQANAGEDGEADRSLLEK